MYRIVNNKIYLPNATYLFGHNEAIIKIIHKQEAIMKDDCEIIRPPPNILYAYCKDTSFVAFNNIIYKDGEPYIHVNTEHYIYLYVYEYNGSYKIYIADISRVYDCIDKKIIYSGVDRWTIADGILIIKNGPRKLIVFGEEFSYENREDCLFISASPTKYTIHTINKNEYLNLIREISKPSVKTKSAIRSAID
jgi:hypothetical protein